MVQVIVPVLSTATLQSGGPPVAHLGDPDTNVVPVGGASVTVTGAVVVDVPVFDTVSVYRIGVVEPATTPALGLADLTTLMRVTSTVAVPPPVTGVCEFGGVPEAVAVSLIVPLSRSAWVTV